MSTSRRTFGYILCQTESTPDSARYLDRRSCVANSNAGIMFRRVSSRAAAGPKRSDREILHARRDEVQSSRP
jgi:hypothetical protein